MVILACQEIEALLDFSAATNAIKQDHISTNKGKVNTPPVGHITFSEQADYHIKYRHMKGDAYFVIKVATGFPKSSERNLPNGNEIPLLLSAETGALKA